jgi:hypothetical protein
MGPHVVLSEFRSDIGYHDVLYVSSAFFRWNYEVTNEWHLAVPTVATLDEQEKKCGFVYKNHKM